MDKVFSAPRGMKDVLPDEEIYWRNLYRAVEKKCEGFNFKKIEPTIVENKELFDRSVGKETDIVNKEMYEVKRFTESSEERASETLCLRPEITAGVVRTFIENMQSEALPIKLWYFSPMFRAERPQAGRLRQFYQFGFEILGDETPMADALLIYLSTQILEKLGLKKSLIVEINSIGCESCRPKISKNLIKYLQKYRKNLCPTCQDRLKTNPMRVYDCKVLTCQQVILEAPQTMDSLCGGCQTDFRKVLEGLEDLEIKYDLNPRLVRGLDYYTKTVFEIKDEEDLNRQSALGGGGRYDNLVEFLGGVKTPAVGAAFGVERLILKMKEKNINVGELPKPKVFVVAIGEKAKKNAITLIKFLVEKNISQDSALGRESLKSQLKMADKSGAKYAMIIGQKEILDGTIILRNLEVGRQETLDWKKLEKQIKKVA